MSVNGTLIVASSTKATTTPTNALPPTLKPISSRRQIKSRSLYMREIRSPTGCFW